MDKYKVAVLFLWALFSSFTILELKVKAGTLSPLEIEIESKLKLLNKPAVKTIKSEDGDVIDCIKINKQPAFDHPALKNHVIQRIPDFLIQSQNFSTKDGSHENFKVFQTWQKSGRCPKGTIPIRRIQKEDLLRVYSLDRFGQKPPEPFTNSTNTNFSISDETDAIIILPNRSTSHLMAYGQNFIGAQADINIWNPKVDLPDDFTTAQIWLKTASSGTTFESVEAGWVVNPMLYGDHRTRLFAYWTRDSYKSTGCFDITCKGFVQIAAEVALGSALKDMSSVVGLQYDINIGIFQDENGNWWLRVNNNVIVGYWPKELLSPLNHAAQIVEWGGAVFSSEIGTTPHTKTEMGSGQPAEGRYSVACYIKHIKIKDSSKTLKYPELVNVYDQERDCYNALIELEGGLLPILYFGGHGRNLPFCP